MGVESGTPRVSHERLALAGIADAIAAIPEAVVTSGQGAGNRFDVAGWSLTPLRQFQFGDLRVETPQCTVVVEAESAGGITNLAKDWPLLRAKPTKRFVLAHLFNLGSDGDYTAHRMLWDFLVTRMRDDLGEASVRWPEDWEARLFCYRNPGETSDLIEFLLSSCAVEGQVVTSRRAGGRGSTDPWDGAHREKCLIRRVARHGAAYSNRTFAVH